MSPHTKRFDMNDQQAFAALSGDSNPIHVDPLASRRTQMGAPVVHGVHLLLWALESFASSDSVDVVAIEAFFRKPVYLGEEVSLAAATRDGATLLDVMVEATPVVSVHLATRAPAPARGDQLDRDAAQAVPVDWPRTPLELQLADMADRKGMLPLEARPTDLARAFPSLVERAGAERVTSLLSLSRLVGMVCPGLHSILASLDVAFATLDPSRSLLFRVVDVDDRFRKIRMAVDGGGLQGVVEAFARQPPTRQPSMQEVAEHVRPGAFRGGTALVVGGSRGLGEVAAKVLAAGGATPVVTYAVGRDDAERVAGEIEAFGRPCKVRRLDVRHDVADQMAAWQDMPDTLYYFATRFISPRHSKIFDPALFAEFVRFYVTGFQEVTEAALRLSGRPLRAFYPSSVLVAERPRDLTEYAMAKCAGEVLCADLDRYTKALTIVVRRLPRLLTDQTATVYPAKMEPTLATMAEVVAATQGGAPSDPQPPARSKE